MKLYFLAVSMMSIMCGCTPSSSKTVETKCEKTCSDSLKCDSVKTIIDTIKTK